MAAQEEKERQIDQLEHLNEEEIKERVAIAAKLVAVQKELLATREPKKVRNRINNNHEVLSI